MSKKVLINLSKGLLAEECDAFFGQQRHIFASGGKSAQYKSKGELSFRGKKRKNNQFVGIGKAAWNIESFSFTLPSGAEFQFEHKNGAEYLAGGWLEELSFIELYRSQIFDQVILNAELSLKEKTIEEMQKRMPKGGDYTKNEIDVVATRGAKAALIECKAGKIGQEHVNKLAVLRDQLLGSFGIAVLVARNPVPPHIEERCRDLKVVTIFGDRIKSLPNIIEKEFNK